MGEVLLRCNGCGVRISEPIPAFCSNCRMELSPLNLFREPAHSTWRSCIRAGVVVLVLFFGTKLLWHWTGW